MLTGMSAERLRNGMGRVLDGLTSEAAVQSAQNGLSGAPVSSSRLEIVQDGRVVRTLLPLNNAAVDVLFAAGTVPAPGRYDLRWTAISGDGEQSSGQIPFAVPR